MTHQEDMLEKHNSLCDIVKGVIHTLEPDENKIIISKLYDKGEIDVFYKNIYYEIKCSYNCKTINKARNQIERAIHYNQAKYGYMVTYDGVYDILLNEKIKL